MPGQDDRKIKRFVNSKIDRKVDKVDDRKIVTEIDEEDTWIERQIERQIWIDRWMCGQIDDKIEVDIEIERKLQINRWIDLQKDRQISRQIELNVCQWIDMKGWNRQIKFAIGQLVQGVQGKLCFFTIYCNHSLACIAVRDLQSSQGKASVQLLLLAGNFFFFLTINFGRVLARDRWQTFENSWKKHNI